MKSEQAEMESSDVTMRWDDLTPHSQRSELEYLGSKLATLKLWREADEEETRHFNRRRGKQVPAEYYVRSLPSALFANPSADNDRWNAPSRSLKCKSSWIGQSGNQIVRTTRMNPLRKMSPTLAMLRLMEEQALM